ncbi:MAG: oligosaccharide flippase family protein [Pirellulaceae bacterium]|nr:oligosaccharide flippase family protein [Pirellulaceae bacterium]
MRKKTNTSFRGDVLRLASGTGVAQAVGLAAAPILTRLFAPDAFGQSAMFATIVSVLCIVASLGYEYAIVSPKSDRLAANLLVAVMLVCTAVVVLILAPLTIFLGTPILSGLRMTELAGVIWLMPIAVWLHGTYQALNYWNVRSKYFTRLSISQVTATATSNGTNLGFGFAGYATGAYMISAQITGQAIATIVLGAQILRDDGRFIASCLSGRAMKHLLGKYKNFPLYYTGANLVRTVSSSLVIFLLAASFSPAILGFYSLALRLLLAPVGLLGGAISRVFHEKAAVASLDGTLPVLVTSTFGQLANLGVYPIMLTGIFAEELFSFVFGDRWIEAGLYAAILSPYVALQFITAPIGILTAVLQLQRFSLIFNSLVLVSTASGLVIAGYVGNAVLAVALVSIIGSATYIIKSVLINRYAGVPARQTLSIALKPFLPVCFILFLYTISKQADFNRLAYIAIYAVLMAGSFLYFYRHSRRRMSTSK